MQVFMAVLCFICGLTSAIHISDSSEESSRLQEKHTETYVDPNTHTEVLEIYDPKEWTYPEETDNEIDYEMDISKGEHSFHRMFDPVKAGHKLDDIIDSLNKIKAELAAATAEPDDAVKDILKKKAQKARAVLADVETRLSTEHHRQKRRAHFLSSGFNETIEKAYFQVHLLSFTADKCKSKCNYTIQWREVTLDSNCTEDTKLTERKIYYLMKDNATKVTMGNWSASMKSTFGNSVVHVYGIDGKDIKTDACVWYDVKTCFTSLQYRQSTPPFIHHCNILFAKAKTPAPPPSKDDGSDINEDGPKNEDDDQKGNANKENEEEIRFNDAISDDETNFIPPNNNKPDTGGNVVTTTVMADTTTKQPIRIATTTAKKESTTVRNVGTTAEEERKQTTLKSVVTTADAERKQTTPKSVVTTAEEERKITTAPNGLCPSPPPCVCPNQNP